MKLSLLLLLAMSLLAGCDGLNIRPESGVVVRTKYVVTTIPDELLTLPPPTPALTAPRDRTDKEAAIWMIESEKRYLEIEKRLAEIKRYQANKLEELKKQLQVKPEDLVVN